MSTLEGIANKNSECGGASANTGTLGCQIGFGTPLSALRFKKGTTIPKGTSVTNGAFLTYLNGLIAERKVTPLMNATSFEDLSTEDTFSTSTAGVKRLNLKGLVEYKFTYEEGHEFYREVSKMTSFKSSAWAFFDESGNLLIAVDKNGDFVGFTAGQVNPEMTKRKVQGGDPESKSITVQMLNRNQTDLNYVVILAENLGFDAQEDLKGINSASPVFVDVPTAGTTLTVKVVLDSDMTTNVGGLSLGTEFSLLVDGVDSPVTTVAEVADIYTLTIPAITASNEISLSINGVITLEDVMYDAGESAKATVIS